MTKGRRTFTPLTSSDVCEAYNLLYAQGLVAFPPTSSAVAKLEAIIANITGADYGVERYPRAEERVVAYFYFIIKDHPFVDGNKRTASLAFYTLCALNGLFPRLENFTLDQLAVTLERLDIDHHEAIAQATSLLFG